jgi:hypothetical protein
MLYLILSIIALGMLTAVAGRFRNKKNEPDQPEAQPPTCCGQHEVCERDSFRAALNKPVSYYDDEELDRFRRIESHDYTEEATDEFREILYTLRVEEVADWLHSLQLREINLPDSLKDEAFLIMSERQKHA